MDLVAFLAAAGAGAVVGWVLALVLSRLVPETPQPRPTLIGWTTLLLGAGAVAAALPDALTYGISRPVTAAAQIAPQVLQDPSVLSGALAVAGLAVGFMAAGQVADRHWPTGLGLLASGGVLLWWLVFFLANLDDLLLSRS